MTVVFGAAGAALAGTASAGSIAPAYPTGITARSGLLLVVGQRPSVVNSGTVATPAGWTLIANLNGAGGYGTTFAADTANTNLYIFGRRADSALSGTLTVTLTNNNVSWAQIHRYENDTGYWDFAGTTGSDTAAGSPMTIAGAANPGLTLGDMMVAAVNTPSDAATFGSSTLTFTATGATFGARTRDGSIASGNGNDISGAIGHAQVTAGTATGVPTATFTVGGTNTNARGPGVIVRLRDAPVPPLASYSFTGSTLAATTSVTEVTASALTAGPNLPTLNPASGLGYAAEPVLTALQDGTSTTQAGAPSTGAYFQFTLTPAEALSITGIELKGARGGASTPRGFVVRSSVDGYASNLLAADFSTARPTLATYSATLTGHTNLVAPVTFRVYIYAPAAANSVEFEDITIAGTAHAAPNANISTLTDAFDTTDTGKWTFGSNATVSGGALHLAGNTTGYTPTVESVDRFDLTGGSITIQIAGAPTRVGTGTGPALLLELVGPESQQTTPKNGFAVQSSFSDPTVDIFPVRYLNGANQFPSPYDERLWADGWNWWRITESGGNLVYTVSKDGLAWSSLATVALSTVPLFDKTSVRIALRASGAAEHTGTWDIAGVNVTATIPKLGTLTEDFESGHDPIKWSTTPGVGLYSVSGGVLTITADESYGVYRTGYSYDFTASSMSAKVTPAARSGASSSQQTFLMVEKDAANQIQLFLGGTSLRSLVKTAGVNSEVTLGTYDPVAHAWWRIRETAGTARFAVSSDGITWSEFANAPAVSWASDPVSGALMVGRWDGADPATTATFDNINLAPSSGVVKDLAGSAAGTSTADNTSVLRTRAWTANSSAAGTSTAVHSIAARARDLAGAAAGTATAGAALARTQPLAGAADGASTSSAEVAREATLAGASSGQAAASAWVLPVAATEHFTEYQRTAEPGTAGAGWLSNPGYHFATVEVSTAQAHSGTASWRMTKLADDAEAYASGLDVAVEPGDTLVHDLWLYTANPAGGYVATNVDFFLDAGYVSGVYDQGVYVPANTWTHHTVTAVVPAGVNRATPVIDMNTVNWAEGTTLYWDDLSYTVVPAVGSEKTLGGSASGTSSTSASLARTRTLAASSAGTSSTTAALSETSNLAGSAAGTSSTAASSAKTTVLAASSAGTSSTSAALSELSTLGGSATGTSSTAATIARTKQLAATSAGVASTAAYVGKGQVLAGSAAGAASTSAALYETSALAGSATGTSDAEGSVTRSTESGLSGASIAHSSATGSLAATWAQDGAATGTSSTSATLAVTRSLAGAANGYSSILGDVDKAVTVLLGGTAAGTSSAAGELTRERVTDLGGSAAGTSHTTGVVARVVSFAGSADATSQAAAAIDRVIGLLAEPVEGASSAVAYLLRDVDLGGIADGVSVALGELAKRLNPDNVVTYPGPTFAIFDDLNAAPTLGPSATAVSIRSGHTSVGVTSGSTGVFIQPSRTEQ